MWEHQCESALAELIEFANFAVDVGPEIPFTIRAYVAYLEDAVNEKISLKVIPIAAKMVLSEKAAAREAWEGARITEDNNITFDEWWNLRDNRTVVPNYDMGGLKDTD